MPKRATNLKAFSLGKEAFKNGTFCAPNLDRKFMDEFVFPDGTTTQERIEAMEDWIDGWTKENLKVLVNF